jgi:hypothetical protein
MQSIVTLQDQEKLCREAFQPKTRSRRWEQVARRSSFEFEDVWAVPDYDAYVRGSNVNASVSDLSE